jgi:hypothetical protein
MDCPNHRVLVSQPRGLRHFDVETDVPWKCRNSRVLRSVPTPEIRARSRLICLKIVASRWWTIKSYCVASSNNFGVYDTSFF